MLRVVEDSEGGGDQRNYEGMNKIEPIGGVEGENEGLRFWLW